MGYTRTITGKHGRVSLSVERLADQRRPKAVHCIGLSCGFLHQFQRNTITCLGSTFAVTSDDLHQPIERRRTDAVPSGLKLCSYRLPIRGVAARQTKLQLPNGFGIAEPLARDRRVSPAKNEVSFRRSEPTPKNVVERVQVMTPRFARDEYPADDVIELLQCGEVAAVDFVGASRAHNFYFTAM